MPDIDELSDAHNELVDKYNNIVAHLNQIPGACNQWWSNSGVRFSPDKYHFSTDINMLES